GHGRTWEEPVIVHLNGTRKLSQGGVPAHACRLESGANLRSQAPPPPRARLAMPGPAAFVNAGGRIPTCAIRNAASFSWPPCRGSRPGPPPARRLRFADVAAP